MPTLYDITLKRDYVGAQAVLARNPGVGIKNADGTEVWGGEVGKSLQRSVSQKSGRIGPESNSQSRKVGGNRVLVDLDPSNPSTNGILKGDQPFDVALTLYLREDVESVTLGTCGTLEAGGFTVDGSHVVGIEGLETHDNEGFSPYKGGLVNVDQVVTTSLPKTALHVRIGRVPRGDSEVCGVGLFKRRDVRRDISNQRG